MEELRQRLQELENENENLKADLYGHKKQCELYRRLWESTQATLDEVVKENQGYRHVIDNWRDK